MHLQMTQTAQTVEGGEGSGKLTAWGRAGRDEIIMNVGEDEAY